VLHAIFHGGRFKPFSIHGVWSMSATCCHWRLVSFDEPFPGLFCLQ
jgi:hypothetical protein